MLLDKARYEFKAVLPQHREAEFRSQLALHPAGLSTLYDDRIVQSIYLDSPGNHALQENLAGSAVRHKWRVRWYGSQNQLVEATLEKKIRYQGQGWKDLYPLPYRPSMKGSHQQWMMQLQTHLPHAFAGQLGLLRPTQWIRYNRSYLTTRDQHLRITLDRDLAYFDQRYYAAFQNSFASPRRRLLVIEVKCLLAHFDRAQRFIDSLGVSLGRCSKYVMAAAPQEGPL